MTYYYDKEADVMLAVDDESNVRILEPINHTVVTEPIGKVIEVKRLPTKTFASGCPECGSPSKHKKTCSKSKGKAAAKEAAPKRKLGEACKECGSLSRRHKKDCPLINNSNWGNDEWNALDDEPKRAGLLTHREYNQVKTANKHGMDSELIAREMLKPLKEVNTAVLADSYEQYSA